MPSSLAKNIVLSRNLIDAEGEFDKSGEASAAFWLACGNTGISVLLCTTELERPGSPQIPAQSLADAVGFAGLSSSRAVLWHHLAHGFGPPQLSARLTYEPAHLPGLRVRTLYPRQCLACADAHLMGGQVRGPSSHCLCQYDYRTDYEAGRGGADLRCQPALLGRCWTNRQAAERLAADRGIGTGDDCGIISSAASARAWWAVKRRAAAGETRAGGAYFTL